MGDLKAALEDALSGRGRLVTLVGEPGIGKSRTAQELTTYAGLRGCQVLWGRSYEEQGVPPYWPWVQAIRSYVRERDPEQLMSEMGSGAADIAEVVSDVRNRLPGLPPAPQLEPEQARFRLFDSITAFLKTASQRQPLVLVLDDLHWADQPSLGLLQFVARELNGARLLIIGTYRDMELSRQHPLAEALGELTRERLFQRVLLRGLTQEDVSRFIELTSGHAAPRGLAEAVHTQTEGNPLFVTEIVRLLVQEGALTPDSDLPSPSGRWAGGEGDSWTIRIPEGVREVIGRRLNRLSQRCNEALTVASIIGREFTSAQLNSLVEDATEDRLFEILEEALSARVIEELPQSVGSYQFTHALIQETLSSELSLTRRVRLHARIAESLEDMYGSEADVHASELAYHFGQAEAVTGTLKLVHYSLVAGERALAAYAWGESQVHFERGLAAKENQPMDGETAAIVHGLAQAQAAGGDIEEIRSHVLLNLTRAFDYYAETGEIAKAIAVAEHSHSGPLSMVMTDLLSRALRLVDPNSRQEASLLSAYGLSVGINSKDIGPSKQALDRALDISRQGNHTDLEKRALANSAQVNNFHLRFHEGLENALNAIAIESENPVDHLRARLHAGYILANLGRQSEAQEQATAMLAHVETIRDRWWSARAIALNQVLAVARGDWSVASSFEDAHGRTATDWYPRALMEFQLGNFSEGQVTFDRGMEGVEGLIRDFGVVGLPVGVAAWSTPIIARITGVPDRFAEAKSAANVAISSPTGRPIRVSLARLGLALMAVELKDVSASREQYRALESLSGTMFITSSIATDRMLGLLAHTMGDLDVAMRHFEDALVFCRKAGYRPELAWTCCDYADMLRERDAEGDRAKTISLLDESLAISSELGMRPLMERVLSRREILKA